MAELLKEADINVEKKDSEGRTALHHAAQANRKACVSLLIKHKAHINTQDNLGNLP